MKRHAVVGFLLMTGCATSAHVGADDVRAEQSALCKIAEDFSKYRDVELEIGARYVSDGRHEEVLEDASCTQGRRIVDIGRRGDSESVVAFYAERSRICSERGASYLCNTSADVVMVGAIAVRSGEAVLDINEVRRFVFNEP